MVSDIKIDFALLKFALTKIIDENTAAFVNKKLSHLANKKVSQL